MPNNVMRSLGIWRLAARRPHARNFITHSEIWMAILMLYLPPQHFYRNNGSIVVTFLANVCCYLFITLPVILVEVVIGSFSNGSLTRAYDYNRLARVILCIIFLHQFQSLLAGMSNAHKMLTFALAFFLHNSNPHVSLWSCENSWNTDLCCSYVATLNDTAQTTSLKARCSTPLEEFYKHYGNILYSGVYVPSSSTYDGGYASLVIWMLLAAYIFLIAQLSFRDGIRSVTYLTIVPGLLLFVTLFLHCFWQPLSSAKIGNLITRRDNFRDEYTFTFLMPNMYHANQMMIAGGYLVVLHCCRKPHQNDSQLKGLLSKNIILSAVCLIAYKSAICVLRHGTIGVSQLMRQRMARLNGSFKREANRDLFEDSKDWLYQTMFDYIEMVYTMRTEFNFKGSLMLAEGASLLHPILMILAFVGVRISMYKATLELLFQSLGFSELMSGPWQMLTRVSLPLSVLAINLAADNDICRDYFFPKEPIGFAFCSIYVASFLPTYAYASLVQRMGRMGQSLHWRMMEYALRFKRRITILGLLAGFHFSGAQIYKNVFSEVFRQVLRKNKPSVATPHIDYFFQYDVGVYGATAQRVFSYSGTTANWILNDVFMALSGVLSAIFAMLQSSRVLKFLQSNEDLLHTCFCKPARCFKYCLEFYFAVMFGNR